MIFIWKGHGWAFLLVVMACAALLWSIEGLVPRAANNQDLLEMACIAGLSAIVTLLLAGWLEKRDRSKDETLDARTAQALHTLYWVSLANWGYLAALVGSGLLILSILPGIQI